MKIQINNRIVDTEDIREITRPEIGYAYPEDRAVYEAYIFKVKFYEGKGDTMNFDIPIKADKSDILIFNGFNAKLINVWSNNQLQIPTFILEY